MPATTGGLNTTRNNLFYMGAGKESAWGTAVTPTWFWRWLDGSDANPDAKFSEEREGDTSPHVSLMFKTSQIWAIKVVEYVRPISVGYALQALLGSGSDSFAAGLASTLSSPVIAGASTFITVANIGNVGASVPINFSPAYAGLVYETQLVNLAGRTGTGPYTYALAGAGTFQYAHPGSDPVTAAQVHTFTRQVGGFDAYSIEVAFGSSSFGLAKAFRIRDCVCMEVMLDSSAPNKAVKLEHTWYGAPAAIQASLTAITQEGTNIVGAAGGPLTHASALSTWSIDGSTSGTTNAATIKTFKLTLKNTLTPEELQTEGLYPPYYMPGNFDITGDLTVIFQNYNQYLETYYGSTSATTGATDSIITGFGALAATWAPANIAGNTDPLNSLALSLPNVGYKAAKLTPKLDGKPLEQPIQVRAVKSPSQLTPVTLTLTNSWPSAY